MSEKFDRERLKSVIKTEDSWWTLLFPAHAANRTLPFWIGIGATPNQVTIVSTITGFFAAYSMSRGTWAWMALGGIVMQLSFILDCADGQLARFTGKCSAVGGWLDTSTDVLKNFAFFFGLTASAVRSGEPQSIWAWGFFAYFLSVGTMFMYAIRPKKLKAKSDGFEPLKETGTTESIYKWIKDKAYFLSFSVPDQLLLISAGAIVRQPGVTLKLLAVWGSLAMSFSLVRTYTRIKKMDDFSDNE